MGKDEYSAGGGGALKLKGVKSGGVDKKKKKKEKKALKAVESGAEPEQERKKQREEEEQDESQSDREASASPGEKDEMGEKSKKHKGGSVGGGSTGKTEAERRHEEIRKRRLDDRLKREGVKTHKERVEELNKYLSTLSEHHDMPRIGPG